MEYTVDVLASLAKVSDDELDNLLSALEQRVLGPAISFNAVRGFLEVMFTIAARTDKEATSTAIAALREALQEVGLLTEVTVSSLHVLPVDRLGREEAAAAILV